MSAVLLPPLVQAFAPEFAGRFGRILVALAKLVAARFLRNPRLILLAIPLYNRLNHAVRRFERLMARVAAGRLPKPRQAVAPAAAPPAAPAAAPPEPATPRPSVPALPTRRAWLARELGTEGAAYGSQFQALVTEPAAVELLSAIPAAQRLVNPILRMLGIGPFEPRRHPVREASAPRPAPRRRATFPPPRDDDDTPHCSGFPWHLLLKPPQPAPS